jgi:hypothetical protein
LDALSNKRINMAKIKTYENDNTINANDKLIGTDFNDSDKTKNYLVSALKSYILSGLDVRPYKVYTALLTQTGTNAPVAIVLENTLGGNIVWSRLDNGIYIGTLSNSFIENKTGVIINNTAYATDSQITTVDILTTSTVNIQTSYTTDGVFALEDSCMYNNLIEIRVYN